MAIDDRVRDAVVSGPLMDADMRAEHCCDLSHSCAVHMLLTSFFCCDQLLSTKCFRGMLDSLMACINELAEQDVYFRTFLARPMNLGSRAICHKLNLEPLEDSADSLHQVALLPLPNYPWLKRYPAVKHKYYNKHVRSNIV